MYIVITLQFALYMFYFALLVPEYLEMLIWYMVSCRRTPLRLCMMEPRPVAKPANATAIPVLRIDDAALERRWRDQTKDLDRS